MAHQNNPDQSQLSFLFPTFKQMLNPHHPLYRMADLINWGEINKQFECYYKDFGRPSKPIRLMVGMLILKQVRNLSDEALVEQWEENPYYQYFCGESQFQLRCPIEANELSMFRTRIGKEGAEKIFRLSIELNGKDGQEGEVVFDTTVQEKNITFPTDEKLYSKIIKKCRDIAEANQLELRQSYRFVVKGLRRQLRFDRRRKQSKEAGKSLRKLRTIAGRLVRELERNLPVAAFNAVSMKIALFKSVLDQKPKDKNKIYSLHEPHVQCMSKGKEFKKYEYGCKTSIGWTKTSGVIVGAISFEKNIYDGKTLPAAIDQVERLTGSRPRVAIVDRGYRGIDRAGSTQIVTPYNQKAKTDYKKRKVKKWFQRRAGIEPVIGHLKKDHRLARNYLKGIRGDHINALMAASAFNFKRVLRKLKDRIVFWLKQLWEYITIPKPSDPASLCPLF